MEPFFTSHPSGYARLNIFGEINAAMLDKFDAAWPAIRDNATDLDAYIDNRGGCGRMSMNMAARIRSLLIRTRAFVVGAVHSAAMDLLLACSDRNVAEGATGMLHMPQSYDADANERHAARFLAEHRRRICSPRSMTTPEMLSAWVRVPCGTWFDARDLVRFGFADRLIDGAHLRTRQPGLASRNRPCREYPFVIVNERPSIIAPAPRLQAASSCTVRQPIALAKLSPRLEAALRKGASPMGLSFRNSGDGAEIEVFGEVGNPDDFATPADIGRMLRQNKGRPVTVRINSPGGLAYDGIAIHNALVAHDGPVTTVIQGIAGSAASVIAMAGGNRQMFQNSTLYVHRASVVAAGNVDLLGEAIDWLNQLDDLLAKTYAARSGKSKAEMAALMRGPAGGDGTSMDAADAKRRGMIDEILPIAPAKRAAASTSLGVAAARAARIRSRRELIGMN